MTQPPFPESKIWDLINDSVERMSPQQERLWEVIQIMPEPWRQRSWVDGNEGFWAVGIIGRSVIWYNHVEQGFNRSTFSSFGKINEYRCNQDRLEETIQELVDWIRDGYDSASHFGPPRPGPYPG